MDSGPLARAPILPIVQPRMRAEGFTSFGDLLTGLLIGEVKAGTVRARVFAPADYWPQRLWDLFCRHQRSGQAGMTHHEASPALALSPGSARALGVDCRGDLHRKALGPARCLDRLVFSPQAVAGRTKPLKGHCDVFAAPRYS